MTLKQILFIILSFILLFPGGIIYAQEESEETSGSDEIVISATGYPRPLTSTTGGIGIISSETIMKRDPVSISDAMQDITGVYKTADSSWGSEVSIRGATRDKVVMIIDGSRLNTATDIGAQFGTLNPVSVERIEILKGPISSLYGSGSIGGVVNIFTRTGRFSGTPCIDSGLILSGENNSEGGNLYGFTSYNGQGWYAFGSGSFRSHDNYSDGNGDEVENSGFNDAEGILNLGFKPATGHTIEFRSQYYQGWDIGIPGARDSVPVTASSAEYKKMRRGLVSADYKIIPDSAFWLESKVHLYWQYIGRDVEINNLIMKIEPGADHNTAGAQWTNIFGFGKNTIVTGADTWIRTIETWRSKTNTTTGVVVEDTPIPDASYLSAGVFFEDEVKFGSISLNMGGRLDSIRVSNDKSENFQKETVDDYSWNGHAGLRYSIIESLSTAILAASGYRAASLEERYKYIALGTVEHWGNPDLEPERSYFFEYSIHLKTSAVKGDASVYMNFLDNLIAEEEISSTEYRLRNIDKARIWGAEYSIAINVFSRLEIHNNITYIRGEDTKNNEDLPSIAPFRAITGFIIKGDSGISIFGDCVYTAAQNRVPDGSEKSESWTRFDTGLNWEPRTEDVKHKITVTCVNLLDETYYDYLSMSKTGYVFNEPGRTVKISYSMLF